MLNNCKHTIYIEHIIITFEYRNHWIIIDVHIDIDICVIAIEFILFIFGYILMIFILIFIFDLVIYSYHCNEHAGGLITK